MAKTIKCNFCGSTDRGDFPSSTLCDTCVYQHVDDLLACLNVVGRLLVRRNLRRLERQGARKVILCRGCGGGGVPASPWKTVSCDWCFMEHNEGTLLGMGRWSARLVDRQVTKWFDRWDWFMDQCFGRDPVETGIPV